VIANLQQFLSYLNSECIMMNVDEALLKNMTVDQDLAINFLTTNVAKHATHFQHESRMKPHQSGRGTHAVPQNFLIGFVTISQSWNPDSLGPGQLRHSRRHYL